MSAMKTQDQLSSKTSLKSDSIGGKFALTASAPKPTPVVQPNRAMLEAIADISEIQKDMDPSEGKDSLEYLREAREGAMYGYGSDD